MHDLDSVKPKTILSLGPAWAGNSVNCVPFRISGLITRRGVRYCSHYDPEGNVVVTRSASGNDILSRHVIAKSELPFDAHRAISIGLDSQNHLHVAFGAHDSQLLITRSTGSEPDSDFPPAAPIENELGHHISYPMFVSRFDGDQLVLLFRNGSAADAELRIKRFDITARRWRDDDYPIITGRDPSSVRAGPYVNTPAYDGDGRAVLFIVWRLQSRSDPQAVNNTGIDCIVSYDNFRTIMNANREPLRIPATQSDRTKIIAIPPDASLMNQGTSAVRKDGSMMFLTYWDDGDGFPQYRLGWQEGTAWRVTAASRFGTSFALRGPGTLPLPHSRPEILVAQDGRVHVIFRSREYGNRLALLTLEPPEYDFGSARSHILVDEDLGFYEPVVDRTAWAQDGTLAIYVQRCEQHFDGDRNFHLSAAEAQLMMWGVEQFT